MSTFSECSTQPHHAFTALERLRLLFLLLLWSHCFCPQRQAEPNSSFFCFFFATHSVLSSSHQAVKRSTWWHVWRVDANLFWSGIFSWHSPASPFLSLRTRIRTHCAGVTDLQIHKHVLVFVNGASECRPPTREFDWHGWSWAGWGGVGLAGGHLAQTAIGWFDGSYPGS